MCKKILYQILVLSLLGMTSSNEVLAERHTTKGHEQRVERQLLSSEQLLEDLAFIKRSIASVHPEPGFTANLPQVEYIFRELETRFRRPMDRDAAWRHLSKLNPYFSDGHFYIRYQSIKDELVRHQAQGEGVFPFDVDVQTSGLGNLKAVIRGGIEDDRGSRWSGYEIIQINHKPIEEIVRELLSGMPGDTTGFGANLLSRRFWFEYLKRFGAASSFDLLLRKDRGTISIRQKASMKLPSALAEDTKFEEQFKFEILDHQTALLTISEFAWEQDEKSYFEFTRDAFKQMRERGIQRLFIDIRENTGGNDHMWKLGLLNYFSDKRYRNGASYRKRVLEGRQSGTEKVGDVVDGFVDTWVEPNTNEPYFFKGKVYLLIGRLTYSSSILLTNVVQDFGFATVVGEPSTVRARQTGGINQVNILPNSKLEIVIPRFIVDRPSGKRMPVLVQPDIVLKDDPLDKRALVRELQRILDTKSEH